MIPGLHMLFDPETNVKLLLFLSYINPLSIWPIAVMAIAIAVFADMEKNRARVTAVVLWIIGVLFETLLTN